MRGTARTVAGMLFAATLAGLGVLHVARRPSWPPPADAGHPGRRAAATEAFAARASAGPHDAALDFAWSTAATLEPWADGDELLPAHPRGRRSRTLLGAHPHVRLARGRGGHADGLPAGAEAGRGRRGAGHRRRARLQALHAGARDVHAARRGGRGDRRQRRPAARRAASSPPAGRSGAWTSSDAPTIASCTSSTATSPGRAAPASRTTSTTAASTT